MESSFSWVFPSPLYEESSLLSQIQISVTTLTGNIKSRLINQKPLTIPEGSMDGYLDLNEVWALCRKPVALPKPWHTVYNISSSYQLCLFVFIPIPTNIVLPTRSLRHFSPLLSKGGIH